MKKLICILLLLIFASVSSAYIIQGRRDGGNPCISGSEYGETSGSSTSGLGVNTGLTTGPITVDCDRNGTWDFRINLNAATSTNVSMGIYLDDGDNTPDAGDSLHCSATWTINEAGSGWHENSTAATCDLSENDVIWILVANDTSGGTLNTYRNTSASGERYYKSSAAWYNNLPSDLTDVGSGPTSGQEYHFTIQVP